MSSIPFQIFREILISRDPIKPHLWNINLTGITYSKNQIPLQICNLESPPRIYLEGWKRPLKFSYEKLRAVQNKSTILAFETTDLYKNLFFFDFYNKTHRRFASRALVLPQGSHIFYPRSYERLIDFLSTGFWGGGNLFPVAYEEKDSGHLTEAFVIFRRPDGSLEKSRVFYRKKAKPSDVFFLDESGKSYRMCPG